MWDVLKAIKVSNGIIACGLILEAINIHNRTAVCWFVLKVLQ